MASSLVPATLLSPWSSSGSSSDRFFVPFAIALHPAGGVGRRPARPHRRQAPDGRKLTPLGAMGLVAIVALHMDGVSRQYSGQIRRTARQIEFQTDSTRELVDWIRASRRAAGRGSSSGATCPGPGRLDGGYKAYLQPLTGRPLIGIHQNVKVVDLDVGVSASGRPTSAGALETLERALGRDPSAMAIADVETRLDGAAGSAPSAPVERRSSSTRRTSVRAT